jgi:hypothetical protein
MILGTSRIFILFEIWIGKIEHSLALYYLDKKKKISTKNLYTWEKS